jgi:hypothetical protein
MSGFLAIVLTALVALPDLSSATASFSYGLQVGMSRSNTSPPLPSGAEQIESDGVTSLTAGGFLWIDAFKSASLGTEPRLALKGSKTTEKDGGATIITELSQPYLSLPFLARYSLPRIEPLSLIAGPSAEVYLGPSDGVRNRVTLAIIAGASVEWRRLSLDFRYSQDLTDAISVSQGGQSFSQKNSIGTLLLGVRLSSR